MIWATDEKWPDGICAVGEKENMKNMEEEKSKCSGDGACDGTKEDKVTWT